MTDKELYILRHTEYNHIKSDARAAEAIAHDLTLSVDSVRGRISRADTPQNQIEVARLLATTIPTISPSIERQLNVISASKAKFDHLQRGLVAAGQEVVGIFSSDTHNPYMRWDAVNLQMQIISDLQPTYFSAMNDFNDNSGYGRWGDSRTVPNRLWSADLGNMRASEKAYYTMVRKNMAKGGQLLGVAGNHDNWWFSFLREHSPSTAEEQIANYLEWLYEECGVLVFENGRENAVKLSPNLVWWHGQFVAKSPMTNAKSTLEQFVEDGVAATVVVGHTHRPVHIPGAVVGYPGVDFYNSPCMSRITQVPYLKRDPRAWGLGITICHYVPGTRQTRCELVVFKKEGAELVAYSGQKRYATALDERVSEF